MSDEPIEPAVQGLHNSSVEPSSPHSANREADSVSTEPESTARTGPGAMDPAEQMAAYEEALKETDWGHQPC